MYSTNSCVKTTSQSNEASGGHSHSSTKPYVGGSMSAELTTTYLTSEQVFPISDPYLVFSDGEHLYLNSGLRHLVKYSVGETFEIERDVDFSQNGFGVFGGYDRESQTVWAISYRENYLHLYDQDLVLRRSIRIPRNEGTFFTYDGQAYFIDAYNPPCTVYRLKGERLEPAGAALPPSPFARDYLSVAYGYPFPVFYYKASRIIIGFDGESFRRIGRVKGVNELMYDCVSLPGEQSGSLTMSNNSDQFYQTELTVLDESFNPLTNVELSNAEHSGSFCLVGNKLVVMSHHQGELKVVPLEGLYPAI